MLAVVLVLQLVWGGPAAASDATAIADSITDTSGVPGLVRVISEPIDFAAEGLAVPSGEGLPEAWVKSFTDGADTVSIVAAEHRNLNAVRAGLAGAMADIAPSGRKLHETLDGVVVGEVTQPGGALRFALYGEGLTSFTIAASGPNRVSNLEQVLATQIDHSVGERFPLRVDENERYLAEIEEHDGSYQAGRFVGLGILVLGIALVISRYRKKQRS